MEESSRKDTQNNSKKILQQKWVLTSENNDGNIKVHRKKEFMWWLKNRYGNKRYFLKKLLTNKITYDKISKLSHLRDNKMEEELLKNFFQKWKKLLTNEFESDIVNKLSLETNSNKAKNIDNWTVK